LQDYGSATTGLGNIMNANGNRWKRIVYQYDLVSGKVNSVAYQPHQVERGFEYLDKELAEMDPQPDEDKDTRFADKLIKVYHRDGEEEWILLHVEVQADTYKRAEFSERMYQYFYRIRDRYKKPVSAGWRS
jgi:hypothetical protein